MKLIDFIKEVEEVSSLPVYLKTNEDDDLKEGVYITPSLSFSDNVKNSYRVKLNVVSTSFTKANEVSMQISKKLLVDKLTYITINGGGVLNTLGFISLINYYEFIEKKVF